MPRSAAKSGISSSSRAASPCWRSSARPCPPGIAAMTFRCCGPSTPSTASCCSGCSTSWTCSRRPQDRSLLDALAVVSSLRHARRDEVGPPSGSDTKLAQAVQRYLFTVFGYGCNLGPGQTARHAPEVATAQALRRINAQHVTGAKLEAAMVDVVDHYARPCRTIILALRSHDSVPPPGYTVPTGVSGDPTAPGSRRGGAVSRKRVRPCAFSQAFSSPKCHNSPRCRPSLNRHSSWSGS